MPRGPGAREHAPPEEERGGEEARVLRDVNAFVRDRRIEERRHVPHPQRDGVKGPGTDRIGDRAPQRRKRRGPAHACHRPAP